MTSKLPNVNLFQLHQALALHDSGFKVGILSSALIPARYAFSHYPYKALDETNTFPILRKYHRQIIPTKYKKYQESIITYRQNGYKLYIEYKKKYGKPDIIHAHNFEFGGFIAEIIKEKESIPFVITEHSSAHIRDTFSTSQYEYFKECAKNASFVSAVSERFSDLLETKIQRKVYLLPNVIDPSFESLCIAKKKNQAFTLINVASLDANKNHQLLIRSFAKAFSGKKSVTLKIAGSGKLLTKLRKLTVTLGIESQVIFTGHLSRRNIKALMLEADCLIVASQHETFGVVIIEALACGLPVISTRCGGPEDIIDDTNGILVHSNSINQMAEAMLKIKENINIYEPKKLRNNIISRFGSNAFSKKAKEIYQNALNKN